MDLIDDVDLFLELWGAYSTSSLISRTSFTLVFEAPSISMTSGEEPFPISTHEEQVPQGLAVGPDSQFRDRARIRAVEVFPVPRGPENR